LDPSVICTNFTDNGQNPPVAGQSASSTSTNNYINFCALTLPGTPLTNGGQITTGSCNPAPIGLIPSTSNMPSAKFTFPENFATIPALTAFNISMALNGMEAMNAFTTHADCALQAGHFTNAQKTYFASPQFLNAQGQIVGHAHFVVEALSSIDQVTPNDPKKFVFFKGIDDAGVNGILSTPVTAGVPPGAYRVCSINSAANHQPVIVPIAQHGSLDDCSYVSFTAVTGGANSTAANSTASASASASASATGAIASSSAIASAAANSTVALSSAAVGSASAVPVASASAAAASAVATGKAAQGKGGSKSVSAVPSAAATFAPAPAVAAAVAPSASAVVATGKAGKGAVPVAASAAPSAAVSSAAAPAASAAAAGKAAGKEGKN
ncbi:hypothetical protein C8R44DRAFT_599546, partial [Mycena epipterygia]